MGSEGTSPVQDTISRRTACNCQAGQDEIRYHDLQERSPPNNRLLRSFRELQLKMSDSFIRIYLLLA
jgi:hypothetical protein